MIEMKKKLIKGKKIIRNLQARRKISGYIGDISSIYRVSGGVDTIFRGEKSEGRYFRKYCQNIADISAWGDISEIF